MKKVFIAALRSIAIMACTVWAGDEDKMDQATRREEQVDKVIRDLLKKGINQFETFSAKMIAYRNTSKRQEITKEEPLYFLRRFSKKHTH